MIGRATAEIIADLRRISNVPNPTRPVEREAADRLAAQVSVIEALQADADHWSGVAERLEAEVAELLDALDQYEKDHNFSAASKCVSAIAKAVGR